MSERIPLKTMIQELRTQLGEAIWSARDETLLFDVEGIDVELQVLARSSEETCGGVNLWVTAGFSASDEHQTTHTVRLKLVPRELRKLERKVVVGDRRPASRAPADETR